MLSCILLFFYLYHFFYSMWCVYTHLSLVFRLLHVSSLQWGSPSNIHTLLYLYFAVCSCSICACSRTLHGSCTCTVAYPGVCVCMYFICCFCFACLFICCTCLRTHSPDDDTSLVLKRWDITILKL